jgi:CheY-like chemotaxis protein
MTALARRSSLSLETPVSSMPVSEVVPRGARPLVLLVDPDPAFRVGLALALESRFEVHEAADGHTGLALARAFLPALVVAELDLPGLDGFMLAKAIKAAPGRLRHVPVIFVSSRSAVREVAYAIAAGARRFLMKPCVPDTVLDIATRIVGA